MIRIRRPHPAPDILRIKGKNKRRGHSLSYTRDTANYRSGQRKFDFYSGIYGHRTVKAALTSMQHEKCAYCESKLTHIAYGDVEHFRPKGGFTQQPGDALLRPGYYWLAYEWPNLLFSCQLCNQRYKKNLFPLLDPASRATNHHDDIARESAVFIDPSAEDPETSITFRAEVARGVDPDNRGDDTIAALDLNRRELLERRRDRYTGQKLLFQLILVASAQPDNVQLAGLARDAERALSQAQADDAEYAAMVRAAVSSDFDPTSS